MDEFKVEYVIYLSESLPSEVTVLVFAWSFFLNFTASFPFFFFQSCAIMGERTL